MIIYAPAKLNLYLRVTGKRKDGYHNIRTVFEKIDIFDRIIFRSFSAGNKTLTGKVPAKIRIFCDHPDVPTGKNSLIYRTAELMIKRARRNKGIEIRIFKKIPVAAGLGGGSSDAAGILKGLNKMWRLGLSEKMLMSIGKKLGADIPFFISKNRFAYATGIGDRITNLRWRAKFWHLVVSPPMKLLSGEVYKLYSKNFSSGAMKKRSVQKMLFPQNARLRPRNITGFIYNDLEKAVFRKEPRVRLLKDALRRIQSNGSLVSGSGPSVFSIFRNRKEALRAKRAFLKRFPMARRKGWRIFMASTL